MAITLLIWIIIILVVIIAFIFIYYYNRFIVLANRIENSLSQINVQLKKRSDLVPNLINTVKGYAKHERSIMADVTKARKEFLGAKTIEKKAEAGSHLQNALKSIFALAENYPDLKANKNFLHLQQELSAIEDKVAYARQHYNDSILSYNNSIQTFPGNFFAGLYKKGQKQFIKISEEAKAVPKVDF